ncbi:mechanosensitive ion channel [bacterium]|nr:mechanosensitive ion channel [bacterium]
MDFERLLDLYIIPWGINIAIAIAIFFIGKQLIKLVLKISDKIFKKMDIDETLRRFIVAIFNGTLLSFLIIAVLDRLGVNTTSFAAILGAAGLAVGFALKNSLQNFASGAMLIVFKPFKIGDFVEAGGVTGVIDSISIFSTTLKTGDNQKIIVPNGSVYGGKIVNFSAFSTRRVDIVVGISYESDFRKAKDILISILNGCDKILKDPEFKVALSELGESSVNFIVRPWVNSADYWDVKFYILEQVKERFDAEGITIPYPQMDVHIKNQK